MDYMLNFFSAMYILILFVGARMPYMGEQVSLANDNCHVYTFLKSEF